MSSAETSLEMPSALRQLLPRLSTRLAGSRRMHHSHDAGADEIRRRRGEWQVGSGDLRNSQRS